jgi:hypothetical protein
VDKERKDVEKDKLKRKKEYEKDLREKLKQDDIIDKENKKNLQKNELLLKKNALIDKNKSYGLYRKDFNIELKKIRQVANDIVLQYFDSEEIQEVCIYSHM